MLVASVLVLGEAFAVRFLGHLRGPWQLVVVRAVVPHRAIAAANLADQVATTTTCITNCNERPGGHGGQVR
jgi:hypothetical protein